MSRKSNNVSNGPNQYNLFKVLSHPIRQRLIELIHKNIELPYTEILNTLKIDAGQLNFHLKHVKGLYTKNDQGNYMLTEKGRIAYGLIKEVKKIENVREETIVIPKASTFRRFVATVIDFALFIGSPIAVVLILSICAPLTPLDHSPIIITMFLHSVFFLTFVAFSFMEAYQGQTPGKFIMQIIVIHESGRRLNLMESVLRNIAKLYLFPIDLLLGVLFVRKKGYYRIANYYLKAHVIDVSTEIPK